VIEQFGKLLEQRREPHVLAARVLDLVEKGAELDLFRELPAAHDLLVGGHPPALDELDHLSAVALPESIEGPTGHRPTCGTVLQDDRDAFRQVLPAEDRKSTRLNSSHVAISYAVFC